jgi:hypothetical protein
VTFSIVDNVFLDIVSKQPDKIYGFQHSNFATMCDYINDGFLRGIVELPPIFGAIGAICGAIGASGRKLITRFMSPVQSN